MHRSGTTMVAEALNHAGCFMGVFRDHNGESLPFLSLNQQMLERAGGSWLNPVVPDEIHDLTLPALEMLQEHYKAPSVNRTKLVSHKFWGWKDPRNTYTLALWLKRFPDAKVLHVLRDGRAVAMSLKNRNKVSGEVHDDRLNNLDFNFKLWEDYTRQGLSFQILGNRYFEVRYEEILDGNQDILNKLDDFSGVSASKFLKVKQRPTPEYPSDLNQLALKSDVFKQLAYPL